MGEYCKATLYYSVIRDKRLRLDIETSTGLKQFGAKNLKKLIEQIDPEEYYITDVGTISPQIKKGISYEPVSIRFLKKFYNEHNSS